MLKVPLTSSARPVAQALEQTAGQALSGAVGVGWYGGGKSKYENPPCVK